MLIVACVDGSDLAPAVVDRAVEYARRREADLHVVHVFQPPMTIYALEPGLAGEAEELEAAERDAVWGPLAERLDGSSYPWTRVDLHGYPVTQIVEYAKETGADLIVIGTRGRGELASFILGSTSHGVIQQAPCDVLVVHAPRMERNQTKGTRATAS